MTDKQVSRAHWSRWTIEIKVWKILVTLVVVPILVMWFMVVRQHDEILALIRNDVVTDPGGQRSWEGSFVNTNRRTLRDVVVSVNFLDSQDRAVGMVEAEAAELLSAARLDLRAPLPDDAVRMHIYSVQWRMGRTNALMGPFRVPWEFGYLMVDPDRLPEAPPNP